VTYGAAVGTLPGIGSGAPTRTGYTFSGWSTTSGAINTADFTAATVCDFTSKTVYAVWTARTSITLDFDPNGGTAGTTASKNVTYGAAVGTLPATGSGAPTRDGYTFSGWSTTSGAINTADFTAATVCDFTSKTVYAVWTRNSYDLTYDLNDGGDSEYPAARNGGQGTDLVAYGARIDSAVSYADNSGAKAPTRIGYDFAGWYLDAACNTEVDAATMPASNRTIYAKWEAVTYSISYYNYDGTTLAAGSRPASYTVMTLPKTVTTDGPARSGYTFRGWTAEYYGQDASWHTFAMRKASPSDAAARVIPAGIGLYGNLRLTANYTLNAVMSYTLSFAVNGTAAFPTVPTSIPDVTVNEGSKISEQPGYSSPSRSGHRFDGWYLDNTFTQPVTAATSMPSHNQTIYAKWTRVYTVTFYAGGGTIAAGDETRTVISPQTGLNGTGAANNAMPKNPTRSGSYTFTGWNTQANGSGTAFTSNTAVTDDIAVWAQWRYNGGGTPPPPPPPPVIPPDSDSTDSEPDENGTEVVPNPVVPEEVTYEVSVLNAAREAGIPVLGIGDGGIPLFGPKGFNTWALMDLIIALAGMIVAIITLVGMIVALVRRRNRLEETGHFEAEDTDAEKDRKKRRLVFRTCSLVPAIIGVGIFLLTQNTSHTMVLVDQWTIVLALIFAAQCLMARFRHEKKDWQEWQEQNV
jgi:uncharacterized repeat protein (TIGR02543 family)